MNVRQQWGCKDQGAGHGDDPGTGRALTNRRCPAGSEHSGQTQGVMEPSRGSGAKGDGAWDKAMTWSQGVHLGDRAKGRYRGRATVYVWGVRPEDELPQHRAEVHPGGRARGRAGDLLWCSWGRGSWLRAQLNPTWVGVLSEPGQGH